MPGEDGLMREALKRETAVFEKPAGEGIELGGWCPGCNFHGVPAGRVYHDATCRRLGRRKRKSLKRRFIARRGKPAWEAMRKRLTLSRPWM
jgi:hypothetical protein